MPEDNTGNFGSINSDAFKDLREELRLFNEGISQAGKAMNTALRQGGAEDLVQNLTRAVNAGKSLSAVTKEDLKTEKGRKEIAEKYNTIKRAQSSLEADILVLKRKIELADLASLDSLGQALRRAVDLAANFEVVANNAGKLAKEVERVAEAGAGFEKISKLLGGLPVIGTALAKPLQAAAQATKDATANGLTPGEARLKGWLALSKSIALTIGGTILTALVQSSTRLGDINKQLGVGIAGARSIAKEYESYATNSENARINTDKLIKANGELNRALGTSVAYTGESLENFIHLTEYMGLSAESAGRLETLSRTTGTNTEAFAGSLAKTVSAAGKANGIFMSTSTALEKIKDLSSATLLNLGRNPEKIGQAIVATEKLGISFQQLNSISNSLLDFESSISNELEAELLTGKQLNFERARALALQGEQGKLAEELQRQVGTAAEFGKMNVIQQQSLATAFGMTSEQMGDMLLKQELLNSLGEEAKDLTAEQAKQIKQMVDSKEVNNEEEALLKLQQQQDVAKKFKDSVEKLKSAFVDFFVGFEPALNSLVNGIKGLTENKFFKFIAGGLASTAGLAAVIGTLVAGKLMGTPLMPMFVRNVGMPLSAGGGMGGTGMGMGLYNKAGYYKGGQLQKFSGKVPAGSTFMKGGLTTMGKGMGLGAVGALAGMGVSSLANNYEEGSTANVGLSVAGGALSGAGTGAMMGSMLAPVTGGLSVPVGAALGAAVGGLTAYLNKKDKQEDKKEKTQEDKYDEMIKLMRSQAEKETRIYMNANEVGKELVIGNPRVE